MSAELAPVQAVAEAAAAGHGAGWLTVTLIYLAAAVLAVPVARLLKLGSIIGYLGAGILIGPQVLGLVSDPQHILHIADFGVVLMLFLVGLELEPRRLWGLRGPIFGWGSVQYFGSAALIALVGVACGVDWRLAVAASLAMADSSTATGVGVAAERNLLPTTAGRSMLSVLLMQDVSAIPVLAFIPLLATGAAAAGHGPGGWLGAAQVVGVIAIIIFGGRLLLRPALRWIARSDSHEIFTAAALLLVVATAALVQSVGMSMGLGSFLAGVLLAESEYRRELEADIEPFKGLLLGLFFIAIGMTIDFGVVRAQPGLVAAIVAGLLAVKAIVLWGMARLIPIPPGERPLFIVLLAQGGEVGFVVLQSAAGVGVVDPQSNGVLTAAITLSMLVTPLFVLGADRLSARLAGPARTLDEISEEQDAPVLVAGFGRYGQIVCRLINAAGFAATVLDHDAETVESVRRFGWKAFYGDAARLDLLRVAGAERAKVFVLAVDDVEQSIEIAKLVTQHFPKLAVVARARNVAHYYQLRQLGLTLIERETFDSALMSGRSVLELLGAEPHAARTKALRFRRHNIALVESMTPHAGDENKLIALIKQGRQQLEEQWARERAANEVEQARRGWHQGQAGRPGE